MKANALYHLMQLRARKLSEHLPENRKTELLEIQASIKIQRKPGTYKIDWKVDQKDYSITLESDPFQFYEKGDNAKRNAMRTDDLNYRTHNWDAALALWQDIFKASDLNSEMITDDGKLAFGKFGKNSTNTPLYQNLGIALLFSILSILRVPLVETLQFFILISVLLLFADNFSTVHLRKPLSLIEKLIIATGCIIPLYYGVSLAGVIFISTGLFLLGLAERQDKNKAILFNVSGITFGLAIYSMGIFAITLSVAMAVTLLLIALVDRQRISISSTGLFIAGILIAWLATYALILAGSFSPYMQQEIILSQQHLNWVTAGTLVLLFLGFTMLWIIGVQYYLLPWLSLFAVVIATVALLFVERTDVLVMLGIFTGFSFFIFERVLTGFFTSMHGSGRVI